MKYTKEEQKIISDLKSNLESIKNNRRLSFRDEEVEKEKQETKIKWFKKGLLFRQLNEEKQRRLKNESN